MSDETTRPSNAPPEEPPSTDRGGHTPPPSTPPQGTLEQFVELVLAGMREELEKHHRRVEVQLETILQQETSFGRRLTELERRVDGLDERLREFERAKTVRPPGYTDTSEPGGEG